MILALGHVPDQKGKNNSEADIAVELLLELARQAPGMQGVITDGVLRGVHIDRLQIEAGLVALNPVMARRRGPDGGRAAEKEGVLGTVEITRACGEVDTVELWHQRGALCQALYTHDGERHLEPLRRCATRISVNKNGTYRSYVEVEIPDPRGGRPHIHRERTYTSQKDRDRGFNRAENIRQIPPGDPDYHRIYGRREDAEAINRQIDDGLWMRRARTLGKDRQLLNLVGHQLTVNSMTLALHRREEPDRAEAA